MLDLKLICADLEAEHRSLDDVVAPLEDGRWDLDTPAEGWTIRDQISHLTFFDEQAELAAMDADGFARNLAIAAADIDGFLNGPLERGRLMSVGEVLTSWRAARANMLDAFASLDPAQRVPWFGPAMSPASFVSARVMETWAHGQDIVDALGVARAPTDRLRHVAHLGVRARRNSYAARGLELPEAEVAVDLTGPNGDRWTWNEGAADRVTGPAVDFCLVVTQRRHPADTDLRIEGALAEEWMSIAQAFAGGPGKGRRPGQFPR